MKVLWAFSTFVFALGFVFAADGSAYYKTKYEQKLEQYNSLYERIKFRKGETATFGKFEIFRIDGGPWYHLKEKGEVGDKITKEMKDYLFDLLVLKPGEN